MIFIHPREPLRGSPSQVRGVRRRRRRWLLGLGLRDARQARRQAAVAW